MLITFMTEDGAKILRIMQGPGLFLLWVSFARPLTMVSYLSYIASPLVLLD